MWYLLKNNYFTDLVIMALALIAVLVTIVIVYQSTVVKIVLLNYLDVRVHNHV